LSFIARPQDKPEPTKPIGITEVTKPAASTKPTNPTKVVNKVAITKPNPLSNSNPKSTKEPLDNQNNGFISIPKVTNGSNPQESIKLTKDENPQTSHKSNQISSNRGSMLKSSDSRENILADTDLPITNKPNESDDPIKDVDIIY
jgi:hypothetical protein